MPGNQEMSDMGPEHERFHCASSIGPVVQEHLDRSGNRDCGPAPPLDGGKSYGEPEAYQRIRESASRADSLTLRTALARRRSVRSFAPATISEVQLGAMLGCYSSTGELATTSGSLHLRSTPSAGGMFPIEVYLAIGTVIGLSAGTYHFRPEEQGLMVIRPLDRRILTEALGSCLLEPQQTCDAAGAVLLSARVGRASQRYGERAYRYALLEAGHIAQTLALGAVDAGIGTVFHGAFYDDRTNNFLGLDGVTECVVGILLFGAHSVP